MDIHVENAAGLCRDSKAVLFDLDGTLIESFASVRDTLISALLHSGYQPPEGDVYGELFGRSEHDVFVKLGFPEEKIPGLMDEWTRFTEAYTGEIPYFEGIPELLQCFAAARLCNGRDYREEQENNQDRTSCP